jgi:LmbE family N-acetylglucosaminyl deacetylase
MAKKKVALPAKTLLVCFPHVDDETGVVGTMAKHAQRGDRVVLAFATYGEMTSLFGDMPQAQIRAEREQHARRLAEIVGCEVRFLEFADAHIGTSREEALSLAALLTEVRPDALLTYNNVRGHPDHRHLSELLRDAITYARLPRLTAPAEPHRERVSFYALFDAASPHPPVHVDVSDHIEQIKAVMEIYAEAYKWSVAGIERARTAHGAECGVKYAEKFNVLAGPVAAEQYLIRNAAT